MSSAPTPLPEGLSITARRTESLDAPEITKLITPATLKLFGRVHVANIIEKANLAVTMIDGDNAVVGHAAFYDYPNWIEEEGNTCHWKDEFKKIYQLQDCDSVNTLFLHYYVTKEEYSEGVMNEIVRTVFHAIPLLHFLILLTPPDVERDESMSFIFNPVERFTEDSSKHQAYVAFRHNFCPVLHIRPARIEDHDDLMPIFDRHNSHLTEIYGDFFLAELMEAEDEMNKCIVADVDGKAVGFMSVSTNINMNILRDNFHLEVYDQFAKKVVNVTEVKKLKQKETPASREGDETVEGGETIAKESPQPRLSPDPEDAFLSPTPVSSAKRLKSPSRVKSASKSRTKLSSAHLRQKEEEYEIEYIKEVFDVDSVFCIQLFCIDEKYEARSIDFLPAAFKLFEDKEYAIITVPHTVPEFPLLQAFQRVSPKPNSVLPQELYALNKNGLLRSLSVRSVKENDFNNIVSLTETIIGHDEIISDIKQFNNYRRDKDGTRIHAYVALVHDQVVGVCILRQEQDIDYLRSHYNIEDFVYFRLHERHEHAHLHHFVMNPIFAQYAKYFIKEVMYLSKTSCFYYPIYDEKSGAKVRRVVAFHRKKVLSKDVDVKVQEKGTTQDVDVKNQGIKPHSLVTCLNDLVPISSRRQISYPVEELEQNAPVENIIKEIAPFALYHINRKLTLEPKVVINIRFVVVGGSEAGLAALQLLAFCPHLYFNNLTIVTDTDVFNADEKNNKLRNSFLPSSLSYNTYQQSLLSLPTWVNVVHGKMTRINRRNKYLLINGQQKVPYDQLILCTGQQFHTSVPTNANIEDLLTTSEAMQCNVPQVHLGFLPNNVFTLNCLEDCIKVKAWLQNSFVTDKVVVYGNTLEAYCCINGLLENGVKSLAIHHVHPAVTVPSCFNDPHMDDVMKRELEHIGVKTYIGYTLAQWNHGKEEENLSIVSFTSDSKPLALECQAFFCCDKKSVDYDAFKAINDSCLVFDGKLVIDTKFHTNDKCIRAVGPLTKYARRYHSENWTHSNFNSAEVGRNLAESLLELFDPTVDAVLSDDDNKLIPKYKEAKSMYCQLPGGFYYFHVWQPCVPVALETLKLQSDYGQDLVTGDIARTNEPEYFRIHLNKFDTVEKITCLSKSPINTTNYLCLYGMHERYLNNMVQRYKEGLIKDFYKYFKEAWCLAIYHDRFRDFRNEIRDIFATPNSENASLEERVRKMVEEDEKLGPEHLSHLMDFFLGTDCKKTIEERLICFLDYNKYHLPMYARPGML